MRLIKINLKHLVIFLSFCFTSYSYAQSDGIPANINETPETEENENTIDFSLLHYTSSDFEAMKKDYSKNPEYLDMIDIMISLDDKSSISSEKIRSLSYDEAVEQFGIEEINMLIDGFYSTRKTRTTNNTTTDSINKQTKYLNEEKSFIINEVTKDSINKVLLKKQIIPH